VYINILTAGKTAKEFQMKKDKFLILEILAMTLALGLVFAGCTTDAGDTPYTGAKGTLSSLLDAATVGIERWDEGSENERDVTVYSFNPEIKDELIQAIKDAGFFQILS
jgi:hypothetical protein